MQKQIITLMGPTASGKTAFAMALYDKFPIDIISVDSALIYRGMDIGTAKPTAQELVKYPHQLIDICDPAESYSAANFRHDAIVEIEKSFSQGRIPLLVGGTMLYFKALLDGLSPLPSADSQIRMEIENKAAKDGWQSIHDELKKVDPISAQRINANDSQRLNRAYEVYLITGKSLTELTINSGENLPYHVTQFKIEPTDRALLHQRIEQRFLQMLDMGFETEVRHLMMRGDLHVNLPSMRCVGYRQMWEYLSGSISYDEMVFKGICATRQLAKRQITWLRGWASEVHALDVDDFDASLAQFDKLFANV